MLKRLLVLVAALAALFVFAPTASAQAPLPLPTQCIAGTLTPECREALEDLLAPLDGTVGDLLAGQGLLPASCREVLDLNLDDPLTGRQLFDLLQCITALTNLDDREEADGAIDQPYDAAYDAGYGYDIGYDIGYDGDVPEGGVDSGFGPTGSDDPGAPLVARGAALLALLGVLATGLLVMRRRHGS